MSHTPLPIDYFSDVLCVWAYTAQIRVDELKRQFGDRVTVRQRFIPVFGDTARRIGEGWRERGGFEAFGEHVQEVAARFPHVAVHPDVWRRVRPASSCNAHLYLQAVKLACPQRLDEATWAVRLAFFRDARDIGELATLFAIGESLDIPRQAVQALLDNGQAMAAFCHDMEDRDHYRLEGSPTFVLNEGRQKLYGNVGYRVIEANVQELLKHDADQASWC